MSRSVCKKCGGEANFPLDTCDECLEKEAETSITGEQLAALVRDRDELLAALKEMTDKFHELDQRILHGVSGDGAVFEPRDHVIKARALIARIEGGNGV